MKLRFHQRWITTTKVILLGCGLSLTATANVNAASFDDATIAKLFQWAARLTERQLETDLKPPVIHPSSATHIAQLMCPGNPLRCRRVVAIYSLKKREILHLSTLSPDDVLDRSVLLHELVHFLQHRELGEQTNASCEQILANEREAYAAQSTYLRMHQNYFPVGMQLRSVRCPPKDFATNRSNANRGWRAMSATQPGF